MHPDLTPAAFLLFIAINVAAFFFSAKLITGGIFHELHYIIFMNL